MANLEPSILLPALLAGLLVIATHAPLGIQVLNRGIVFIDIAIAQIAGLGVIAADFFGWEAAGAGVQVAALAAALLGALFLTWTERRWPEIQEAIIGTVFVLAATLSVLLLAGNPHGGEYLKDLLVGQILWVSQGQLIMLALLTSIEKTPFFRTVRDHTIMGMFAAPQHGGNFKKIGWTQIGYDDSLNFRAPFGAYDKA